MSHGATRMNRALSSATCAGRRTPAPAKTNTGVRPRCPRRTRLLGLDEDAAAYGLRRIDGDAHGIVVEAAAARRVELPAVPRAAEDVGARERIAAGVPRYTLAHAAEAERAAVMRAAVADSAELSVHGDDADFPPAHTRDDVPVALQVDDRPDVVPVAHARASPSRWP